MRRPIPSWIHIVRQLAHDSRGGAILIASLLLVIFGLGTGGLILDTGRVLNVHSELQSFADHAALAAAGELDSRSDAIDRAGSAVQQLIQDQQSYGNEDNQLTSTDVQLTFLDGLPPLDTDDNLGDFVTTIDEQARFVHVAVDPHTVTSIFLNALTALGGGGGVDAAVQATAIAGWTQYQCDITPLMFCVPNGMSAADAQVWLRDRQIRLKAHDSWTPGAFGLLDASLDPDGPCKDTPGGDAFRCAVAAEKSITKCFAKGGVDIRPGQVAGPSESGFNVRFDIYETNLKTKKNDNFFGPAPNVIKGLKSATGNVCMNNNIELSEAIGLPPETCLVDETCGRFAPNTGISEDLRLEYVDTNYNGVTDLTSGATTRYGMYLKELEAAGTDSANPILTVPADEDGRAQCSSNPSTDPSRRVLTAAAIDCDGLANGDKTNIPVLDFYRVFMTNPAGFDPLDTTNFSDGVSLWVEVIEHIDPFGGGGTTGGFVRDFVQLYR